MPFSSMCQLYFVTPIQALSATFTPKKEQNTIGIINSFLNLVKRSTNEPIQTSYLILKGKDTIFTNASSKE
jgi:hypothetical protein